MTTHEIGHTLGLAHTTVAGAVMQPFYPGYESNFQLGADDIAGINALYREHRTLTKKSHEIHM